MSLLLDRRDPGTTVQHKHEPRMPAPSDLAFDRFAVPAEGLPGLDFELPPSLEAAEPPEARGLRRDEVVSTGTPQEALPDGVPVGI